MNIHKVVFVRIKEEEIKIRTPVVTKYVTEYIDVPAMKFTWKIYGKEFEGGVLVKAWIQLV